MVETKRKKGESFDALLRRWQRRVIESGQVIQAKKIRYRTKAKSKTARQKSALHRLESSTQREYLKKIGKLTDERKR